MKSKSDKVYRSRSHNGGPITEELYGQYTSALLMGDWRQCREIVQDLIEEGAEVRSLYEDLFRRSLYEVGELWETHKVSVATEHLATSITDSLLSLVHPLLFEREHQNKSAVVTCCANEFHQIGAKMVADMFELYGWHGYFLGANTPPDSLLSLVGEKNPDLVAISLSLPGNMDRLISTIKLLRENFSDKDIIVGGHAFQHAGTDILKEFDRVTYIESLGALEELAGVQKEHG